MSYCCWVSCRLAEADIPAKLRPGSSSKDQAAAAAAAPHKPYSHPGPRDFSTAADALPAAGGAAGQEHHPPQHSHPHDPMSHGPPGFSQHSAAHASAHHSPYAGPFNPADAQQAAAYMAAAAAATMRPASGAGGHGHHMSGGEPYPQQQQQQQPPQLGSPGLPEAAPAPKTDPVELSLLTKYLQVVRQTQVRGCTCGSQGALCQQAACRGTWATLWLLQVWDMVAASTPGAALRDGW